jgi:hypothetical protein
MKYTFDPINLNHTKKRIGKTKFKYSSLDEGVPILKTLNYINNKEPLLLKGININDYN